MKKTTVVFATILSMGTVIAAPNLKMDDLGIAKLTEMAGEKSPYYRASKESFPKDYFLVSQNLPFLVGASLYKPNSDTLKLDEKQLEMIIKLRDKTVPAAANAAKEIKAMETELAKNILQKKKTPEELGALVDKISQTRTALTKAHLECIHDVQQILSSEQYTQLLNVAISK